MFAAQAIETADVQNRCKFVSIEDVSASTKRSQRRFEDAEDLVAAVVQLQSKVVPNRTRCAQRRPCCNPRTAGVATKSASQS